MSGDTGTSGNAGTEEATTAGGHAGPGAVWIVGAAGQLGTALTRRAPRGIGVHGLTSADIDVTDAASVRAALAGLSAGDVVINASAYTAVDKAEEEPERAAAVNTDGPAHLAAVAEAAGAWLIHVSTDYVFDGPAAGSAGNGVAPRVTPYEPADSDSVTTSPTVYGATKLAGERAAVAAAPSTAVVRTAWVYTGGPDSPDFVGTMRRLEAARDTITVVDDQTGSPTYAVDLADGLWELARRGPRAGSPTGAGEILHATNAGALTWWEVAQAVFAEVGADPDRVRPCTTDEFPRPAPRPAYSVLSPASWVAAGLTPLRDWRQALHAAVSESSVSGSQVPESPASDTPESESEVTEDTSVIDDTLVSGDAQ
ncbi:dTDP-4-dehydrorhamnose reductase [Gordonia desulfuricans]|uniref:dTDP-4-dehydrorhamnose reductase n=1 Tax=Gordonia desulfuricans TaxID=89051 RepID=UPI0009F9FE26|nr:dTDP-4-dehydrorhamnose reductase [Gordonia desulfuricans]